MDPSNENLDVDALTEEVKRTHGSKAFDYAAGTAKHHLLTAAWKSGALWLKVANRLKTVESSNPKYPDRPPLSH